MDNIATIGGREAMMYQGETPWHRLGTRFDEKASGKCNVQAALEAASLDWKVSLEPVWVKSADGKHHVKVPHTRAVVRDVDHKVLSTVGGTYTPLQNAEAFGVLTEACEQFGVTIETAGALGIGDRVWMLAKMPNSIEPVPGDRVDGYFLITSGHNGWTPYAAMPTPIRVVCQNTLSAALREGSPVVKLRHVRTSLEQMELVAMLVTNLVSMLKQTGETFAQLAAKKLTPDEIDGYIDAVLGIKDRTNLIGAAARKRSTLFELVDGGKGSEFAPKTAWAAYNAVTEYVDHVRTSQAEKMLMQADKSAIFGTNARLKNRALQLALAA